MGRISFPTPENMTDEQRAVYDAVVAGPRGKVVGPLRAIIHNPELASQWQQFGAILRYNMSIPDQLKELAILMTGRRWNCALEWAIHKGEAQAAGLNIEIIDAIAKGTQPDFKNDEALYEIYEYSRQLLSLGDTDESIHAAITTRWGESGVVELTGLIGYYSMVAMTLNSHRIPLPDDVHCDLPPSNTKSLFEFPNPESRAD